MGKVFAFESMLQGPNDLLREGSSTIRDAHRIENGSELKIAIHG